MDENTVIYRDAELYDIASLVWLETMLAFEDGTEIPQVENPEQFIVQGIEWLMENGKVIVAEKDGLVVGVVKGSINHAPPMQSFGLAFGLYVIPHERKAKIAYELIKLMYEWMQKNAGYIMISVKSHVNAGMYEKLGFEPKAIMMVADCSKPFTVRSE